MDLNEFVNTVLLQIVQGVKGSQDAITKLGGAVNPAIDAFNKNAATYFGTIEAMHHVFLVDFDVAVSVAEGVDKSAGAKLTVASFLGVGAAVEASHSTSATNRVSFKIPLALPVDTKTADKLKADRDTSRRALNYPGV